MIVRISLFAFLVAGLYGRASAGFRSGELAPVERAVDAFRESVPKAGAEQLSAEGGRVVGETAADGSVAVDVSSGSFSFRPHPSATPRELAKSSAVISVPLPAPRAGRLPLLPRHERIFRAIAGPILHLLYDLKVEGTENIPAGPVIFVANHVSTMDPPLLQLGARRPTMAWAKRSMVEKGRLRRWLFRQAGAIPVSPEDGKDELLHAIRQAEQVIENGQSFMVFAEGMITWNGDMAAFNQGLELLARRTGAPVVPVNIDGMWGSLLSHKERGSLWPVLRQGRRRVTVRFGKPLAHPTAQAAREAVQEMGAQSLGERVRETQKTLPRAFLKVAKRYWRRRAVADSTGKDLKYGETLTGSLLLAGRLKERVSGERVGVLLPASVGGALANVALSDIGKVPVNLNYTAGKDGMAYALQKAEMTSVVTSRSFVEALKARGIELPEAKYVYLEDVAAEIPKWKKAAVYAALRVLPARAAEAVFLRRAPRSMDDTATVLFTSGSSGKPKGVELTHENIQANVEMLREIFPYAPQHVLLGFLPFFHSFGYTATLWSTLLQGHAAAYHPNPLEIKAIGELAAKFHPTLMFGTPTFLKHFAERLSPEQLASLKLVVAGAEKLRPEVADAFQKAFGVRPLEGYGATELSPVAAANLPDTPRQAGNREGSVGNPVPGTVAKIVDPNTFQPLPYGREGLLLVKGPQVMKGYLDDPEKTAEAIKDGWYVTGDIATIDKDGFITLKGRQSRFSKIGGEMVSHVAVEEALQRASGLADQSFVVVSLPDADKGERLAVIYSGYDGDLKELRKKLQAEGLPNLAIPGAGDFIRVDAIPMLGSGKVDVQAAKKIAESKAKP